MYCRKEKELDAFSEEHVIPQFLGGDFAPSEFLTIEACKKCNNDLGQFVDAGFGKSFVVHSQLQLFEFALTVPDSNTGIRPICLGRSPLTPPHMEADEVCESWLGVLGEQIYWIRPNDERLFGYMGGDPQGTRKKPTRAYFLFSDRTPYDQRITLLTFRDAFKNRKKVKKVLCGTMVGMSLEAIGFSEPDELDRTRIDYFLEACALPRTSLQSFSVHTEFHRRFLAKLAIGFAWVLFGETSLQTEYGRELYRTLWPARDEGITRFRVSPGFAGEDSDALKQSTGVENAVTLVIQPVRDSIVLSLNLGCRNVWMAVLCLTESVNKSRLDALGNGRVIVLFEALKTCVDIPYDHFIKHQSGSVIHPKLKAVEMMAERNLFVRKSAPPSELP